MADERYIEIELVDKSHKVPMPGVPRYFAQDGERVDSWDPFWIQLLADGSVRRKEPAQPLDKPARAPKPEFPQPDP